MTMQLHILFEDNHLLVVSKPAGLATMGVSKGESSLLSVAKEYIKQKYNKPGNVYLGVVSRLDSLVTGVVVFARTSKAASRLSEMYRTGQIEKTYWAIVSGVPQPEQGMLDNWLRKNEQQRKMEVTNSNAQSAKHAALTYRVLKKLNQRSLLEIDLQSGRKHQIRVQLAYHGHPVLGDKKYGSNNSFPNGIALHSRRLALLHPVKKKRLELVAPTPKVWKSFLS